ncbi:adenylate kinase isoenzyme 1-like isoform X2 [Photinus pyralis]|uniref:adenylate kinase isoenzyme 1-like isoform X2 n=1 Tax=Photinus pyralis TaxID=7054 RepID=UPI0012671EBC|nr:adenylate kinase isoenzyme 1-like isoform X2 [Photinus pyralis]
MGVCCSTLEKDPSFQRLPYDMSKLTTNPVPFIWMVGASGTGRHLHARTISEKFIYELISVSNLLQSEGNQPTERGRIVHDALRDSTRKVPDVRGSNGFLFNGFPRTAQQASMFVKEIGNVDAIIYLYTDMQVMISRIREKKSKNLHENLLKRQIRTYTKEVKKAVSKYGAKIEKVCADGPPGVVYGHIEAAINVRLHVRATSIYSRN